MSKTKFPSLYRNQPKILQVNLGYKCNQACNHCHVDASPLRTEMMSEEILSLIPKAIKMYELKVLDITGGAPELHPSFKELVIKANNLNIEIIDRCNLTILEERGYEDMVNFLASNKVRIVASLPCYLEDNVDTQRGKGVFKKSIDALVALNKAGYGIKESNLILDLVYNPIGAKLPPPQKELENDYRNQLFDKYRIEFNNLLTITNMPINRFSEDLNKRKKLEKYLNLLIENHTESNLELVMCLNTLSVDWQGNLYDCDFNQQLKLNNFLKPRTLKDLVKRKFTLENQKITVDSHCFGCTAGNGSSCGGSLT